MRHRYLFVIPVLVIVLGTAALWRAHKAAPDTTPIGPTARVQRGPLVISINESGELEAERRKVISNELRWPVVIRSLVKEGTLVKEGEPIIEFECKELSDSITQQQLNVTGAKSEYTQVREALLMKKKEMTQKVRKAEQAVKDAGEDLLRYMGEGGEWSVERSEAESDIKIAEGDLLLAERNLEFMKKANENPLLDIPYSDKEIKEAELRRERLQLALNKARWQYNILMKYTHPRKVRTLKTAIEDAEIELERTQLEQKTQILTAQANEEAEKIKLNMQQDKLKDLLEEEKKLKVTAGMSGLVIYNAGGSRWRPSTINMEVGEKINPRQQLMIIPDMSTLQIKTRVYEAVIEQVKPDIEAFIRLDSKADVILKGHVSKVGVVPDSQNRWLNPGVKVFEVTVEFDEPPRDLKPGMTAQVELILARLPEALTVPVASVFSEQERTFCYHVSEGKATRVPVKVGRMNDRRVQILSGLAEGDRTLLTPPASDGKTEEKSKGAAPMGPPTEQRKGTGR